MTYLPMLADTASETDVPSLMSRGWVFDMKWDGVRAIADVSPDGVKLLNRKGEDFAFRYPEVCKALTDLRDSKHQSFVLDGEIVIFDPATGKPQFGLTGQRSFGAGRAMDIQRAARTMPATFVAFDVLMMYGGNDLRPLPQRVRWEWLDALVPASGRVCRSVRTTDGAFLLDVVKRERLEGLIAKDPTATYRAGRRSCWRKVKPTRSCTAIVTGYEPGEGKRAATFGALTLAVLSEGGEKVDIGKVGSGFTDADLATLDPVVKSGIEFLVEVEYLDRQPKTGVLRFPVMKGARWDVTRDSASEAQLPSIPT